jgi:hypothetical protein
MLLKSVVLITLVASLVVYASDTTSTLYEESTESTELEYPDLVVLRRQERMNSTIVWYGDRNPSNTSNLAQRDEFPTEVEQFPSTVEQFPSTVEQFPSTVKESPPAVKESPATVQESPAALGEFLSNVEEFPSNGEILDSCGGPSKVDCHYANTAWNRECERLREEIIEYSTDSEKVASPPLNPRSICSVGAVTKFRCCVSWADPAPGLLLAHLVPALDKVRRLPELDTTNIDL